MRGWVPPPPRHPRLRKHWCCWLLGRAPRGARVLEAATTVRQSGVPAPEAAARARAGRDSAWHARLLDHEWTPSEGTAVSRADYAVHRRHPVTRAHRALGPNRAPKPERPLSKDATTVKYGGYRVHCCTESSSMMSLCVFPSLFLSVYTGQSRSCQPAGAFICVNDVLCDSHHFNKPCPFGIVPPTVAHRKYSSSAWARTSDSRRRYTS